MSDSKQGYAVLEVGYEYNDEVYHTGNYGATYEAPKNIFTDKEAAEKAAKEASITKLRGTSLGHYGYGPDEFTNDPDGLAEFFQKTWDIEIAVDDWDEWSIPSSATDEQLLAIQDMINLEFFTVKPVTIH